MNLGLLGSEAGQGVRALGTSAGGAFSTVDRGPWTVDRSATSMALPEKRAEGAPVRPDRPFGEHLDDSLAAPLDDSDAADNSDDSASAVVDAAVVTTFTPRELNESGASAEEPVACAAHGNLEHDTAFGPQPTDESTATAMFDRTTAQAPPIATPPSVVASPGQQQLVRMPADAAAPSATERKGEASGETAVTIDPEKAPTARGLEELPGVPDPAAKEASRSVAPAAKPIVAAAFKLPAGPSPDSVVPSGEQVAGAPEDGRQQWRKTDAAGEARIASQTAATELQFEQSATRQSFTDEGQTNGEDNHRHSLIAQRSPVARTAWTETAWAAQVASSSGPEVVPLGIAAGAISLGAGGTPATGLGVSGAEPTPQSAVAPDTSDRIVQSLRMQYQRGGGDAVVQIKPEHLGPVSISLRVENGVVSAVVTADHPAVAEWLQANEHLLREGLLSSGLHLDRFMVQRDGRNPGGSRRDHAESQRREQPRRPPPPESTFEINV